MNKTKLETSISKLQDYLNEFNIVLIGKTYTSKEFWLSVLTAVIFWVLPGFTVITFAVNLSLLMVHKLNLVLWVMYGILVLVTYFASHIFSVTLRNYREIDGINYNKVTYTLSLVLNIVIFIIVLSIILTVK